MAGLPPPSGSGGPATPATFFFAAAVQASLRSSFRTGPPPQGPLQIRKQIGRAMRFVRANRSVATLLFTGFGNSLVSVLNALNAAAHTALREALGPNDAIERCAAFAVDLAKGVRH